MVLYKQSNRPDHDYIYHFSPRRAQDANLILHQTGSDAIILYDNMPTSALGKVVTFAGEVLFEWKPSTLTKAEATPGDRIDFRISGQLQEPCPMNEKLAHVRPTRKTFFSEREKQKSFCLISSLMKQVLKSPNQSTMINDLINNYSQENTEMVDYCTVPYEDSENHAPQNGHSERHEFFKDRVLCQICFKYQRPGETFCTCGSILRGITEEVKKQAEQRINSQFIMVRSGSSQIRFEEHGKGSTLW